MFLCVTYSEWAVSAIVIAVLGAAALAAKIAEHFTYKEEEPVSEAPSASWDPDEFMRHWEEDLNAEE